MIDQVILHQASILKALSETLLLLGASCFISFFLGLALGTALYLSQPKSLYPNKLVNFTINAYVNVVRSFPFLIFIVMLFPLTRLLLGRSIGTIPAIFPLTLVSIAIFARFVEQALLEVSQTTLDTAQSMGASLSQLLRYFVFPSARQGIILGFTSTIISTLSYSTVVGVVGGGGLGDFAFRFGYQSSNYALMYAMVTMIIIFVQTIQWIGNRMAKPRYK